MASLSDPAPERTIAISAPEPDGCRNRILFDILQLALLAVCVGLLPALSYVAWFVLGMAAHAVNRPVPPANPWAILTAAVASWAWMALGYQYIDHRRWLVKSRHRDAPACVGQFRFDRRLRIRNGSGLITFDNGFWTIETGGNRLRFHDSDRQVVRVHRDGNRFCFSWSIGPDQVRLDGMHDNCEFLPVYGAGNSG